MVLTHWGWVTHIYVSELPIIGSDNGLSPGRRQAIIWTNAAILLIGPSGTNFSGILIEIHTFSFKKMHSKISSRKWWPFCVSLSVLKEGQEVEGKDKKTMFIEKGYNHKKHIPCMTSFIFQDASFENIPNMCKIFPTCAKYCDRHNH